MSDEAESLPAVEKFGRRIDQSLDRSDRSDHHAAQQSKF
jgi:hypothetical protein